MALLILGVLCSCTQTPEQRAKDATVLIIAGNADGTIGTGSGFFVEYDKIATNIHVIDSARIVFAVGTKKVYNIEKVVGYNPALDLVALRVSGKGKPLKLGEGQMDEPIRVVGYPGGGYAITNGKVHGILNEGKEFRLVRADFQKNRIPILFGGNSGGPVLNNENEGIGIATSSYGSDVSPGIFGYASTSSVLNGMLDSSDEKDLSDWQEIDPILAYVYQAWAKEKLDCENYNEAMMGFGKAIALYPDNSAAYFWRGRVKMELAQYQAAIRDFDKAIKLYPDNSAAYISRSAVKMELTQYQAAIEDCDKVINELNSDFTAAYLNRADAKFKLAQSKSDLKDLKGAKILYQEAIQDYTEVIEDVSRNPKSAYIYSKRGNAKLGIDDHNGAIEDYTEATELNPKDAVSYLNRGFAKTKGPVPDYAGAIEDYTQATNLNPGNAMLGHAYLWLGNAKEALGKDESAKLNHAKAYYYEGRENSSNGQYEAAIKGFNKSIELNPDDAKAYYELGVAKQKRGDYEEAKQHYQKVINRKPDYAEAYYNLGVVYSHLNNYKVALDYFDKAIRKKPKFAEAHYNLGAMQYRLGDHKVAIEHFGTAIKLKEELKEPVIYAKAYKARGEVKKALGEDEDAKDDFVMAYYYWGDETYKKGKCEEAIEKFNTILDELEMDISYVYHARGNAKTKCGESKADLGDLDGARKLYQEAIEDYDEAIELAPENALYYQDRGMTKLLRGAIRVPNGMIEDYQAAIADFTKAINRKSDLVDVYNRRGQARCLLGYTKANQGHSKEAWKQYNLALKDFKAANKLDSDDALHYRGLGLANAALGKAKAAIAAFEKAKHLKPESEK